MPLYSKLILFSQVQKKSSSTKSVRSSPVSVRKNRSSISPQSSPSPTGSPSFHRKQPMSPSGHLSSPTTNPSLSTKQQMSASGSSSSLVNIKDLDPEMLVMLSTEKSLLLTLTKSSLALLKRLIDTYTEPVSSLKEDVVEEVDASGLDALKPLYCIKNMVGSTKNNVLIICTFMYLDVIYIETGSVYVCVDVCR